MIALKDPAVFPEKPVIQKVLGGSYSAYEGLLLRLQEMEPALTPEWRYYNDGKAWLCKVVHKRKTVFWLSVWEFYFRAVFYFTEKNEEAISALDIDSKLKKNFADAKRIGKLIPLVFVIRETQELNDLLKVIRYKIKARVVT